MPGLSKAALEKLLDQMALVLGKGFADSVAQTLKGLNVGKLTAAIKTGDIDAVMHAAGMRAGSWNNLTEQVRSAYNQGGTFNMNAVVPAEFGMMFDISNPRAEKWLKANSSTLIKNINKGQREAVRLALTNGLKAGRGPRSVALDIAGRIGPNGKRVGGLVNLSKPQIKAVAKARYELHDVNKYENYLKRARRDRRFDPMVKKAIKTGKRLPSATIDRLTSRYSDRLKQLRGETIARTEALKAVNEASDESMRQVVDEGLAPKKAIKRIWHHGGYSKHERPGHKMMGAVQQTKPMDEPFKNPLTGVQMMYPGDGPGSEAINCRCWVEHKVDFAAVEKQKTPPPLPGLKPVKNKVKPKPAPKPKPKVARALTERQAMKYYADEVERAKKTFTYKDGTFEDSASAYVSSNYQDINTALRKTGGKSRDAYTQKHIDRLTGSWNGTLTRKTKHDMTVFRGTKLSEKRFRKMKVGGTLEDKAFWSTSVDRSLAKSFAGSGRYSVIYEIQTRAGTRMFNPLSHMRPGAARRGIAQRESELILKHGTRIKIISITKESDYLTKVVARVVGEP